MKLTVSIMKPTVSMIFNKWILMCEAYRPDHRKRQPMYGDRDVDRSRLNLSLRVYLTPRTLSHSAASQYQTDWPNNST